MYSASEESARYQLTSMVNAHCTMTAVHLYTTSAITQQIIYLRHCTEKTVCSIYDLPWVY
jgi:hypothetical protein